MVMAHESWESSETEAVAPLRIQQQEGHTNAARLKRNRRLAPATELQVALPHPTVTAVISPLAGLKVISCQSLAMDAAAGADAADVAASPVGLLAATGSLPLLLQGYTAGHLYFPAVVTNTSTVDKCLA